MIHINRFKMQIVIDTQIFAGSFVKFHGSIFTNIRIYTHICIDQSLYVIILYVLKQTRTYYIEAYLPSPSFVLSPVIMPASDP